jgi:hypothetical protein
LESTQNQPRFLRLKFWAQVAERGKTYEFQQTNIANVYF